MPQSGRMAMWSMPEASGADLGSQDGTHAGNHAGAHPGASTASTASTAGLRVEHALRSGDEIPPFYDSMIAKLVARGRNREEALRKLQHGLANAVALGVVTNQAFLARCLAHPVFAAGGATTAFIDDHQAELLSGLTRDGDAIGHQRAAAVAALLLHLSADPAGVDAGAGAAAAAPHGLAHRLPMLQRFELGGVPCQGALVQQGPHHFSIRIDGHDSALQLVAHGGLGAQSGSGPGPGRIPGLTGRSRIVLDGLAETAVWHRDGAALGFQFAGRPWVATDCSRTAATRAGAGPNDGKLRASMNGRVVALPVAVGDAVVAGQPLLTLEAMKMEHVHAAPCAGRVAALHVSLGEQVAVHRVVLEIEPAAPATVESDPAATDKAATDKAPSGTATADVAATGTAA